MKYEKKKERHIAACLRAVAACVVLLVSSSFAQELRVLPRQADIPSNDDAQSYVKGIDDLMDARLQKEKLKYGNATLVPEILRVESNYIRTDAPTGEVVLYESSFHLEPRYLGFSPEGRQNQDKSKAAPQSVMYFVGSARTPLALPLVSNLSKVLSGNEASYTVYLGILPLPRPENASTDSLHYYCVIERAIESNRTESEVRFERYAKEFSFKMGEPIQLRMDNTPSERQAYIIKIEDNSEPLNFYEDFARHFREHIILNSERLKFNLGKASLSMISSMFSVPYTVAQISQVKVELMSVVDPEHPLTLIDSVMRPADYLAEHDVKNFTNGTYRYRLTAKEIGTGNILFTETKDFEKKQPMMVGQGINLANADTLTVGGKKFSAQQRLAELNQAIQVEKVKNERLITTNVLLKDENKDLKVIVNANHGDVIAGIRGRVGGGFGVSTGFNVIIGAESTSPSFTLDASFGLLYSSAPYLDFVAPQNFSQIFKSPKSIGLQVGWAPITFFDGIISPVARLGFYGIYSSESDSTKGRHSATLFAPAVGLTFAPDGIGSSVGIDFTTGPVFGLGIAAPAVWDFQAKFYVKF